LSYLKRFDRARFRTAVIDDSAQLKFELERLLNTNALLTIERNHLLLAVNELFDDGNVEAAVQRAQQNALNRADLIRARKDLNDAHEQIAVLSTTLQTVKVAMTECFYAIRHKQIGNALDALALTLKNLN
jgi:hypothetical protein